MILNFLKVTAEPQAAEPSGVRSRTYIVYALGAVFDDKRNTVS